MSKIWVSRHALNKIDRGSEVSYFFNNKTAHGTVETSKGDLLWIKTNKIQGKFIKPVELCVHRACLKQIAIK